MPYPIQVKLSPAKISPKKRPFLLRLWRVYMKPITWTVVSALTGLFIWGLFKLIGIILF